MREGRYTEKFSKLITKSYYTPTWFNKMLNDDFGKTIDISVVALPLLTTASPLKH
jgi:hypothetical protein